MISDVVESAICYRSYRILVVYLSLAKSQSILTGKVNYLPLLSYTTIPLYILPCKIKRSCESYISVIFVAYCHHLAFPPSGTALISACIGIVDN